MACACNIVIPSAVPITAFRGTLKLDCIETHRLSLLCINSQGTRKLVKLDFRSLARHGSTALRLQGTLNIH